MSAERELAVRLLGMVGNARPSQAALRQIDEAGWQAIASRAAEHRLGPLLHRRFEGVEAVPVGLRLEWQAAHRNSALTALNQRRDLIALSEALAEQHIDALALKGAWLAWHAYAEPAERPMRDIDLLVPPTRARDAWHVAIAQGYRRADGHASEPEAWELRLKHLPPLVSPQDTWCEIHTRLWEEDARHPQHPPHLFETAVSDTADPRLRYLAPQDLLMHLTVHAVVAHRFDGGPLMLIDFARLLAVQQFDWEKVWRKAQGEGWARPLALATAATDRWISPGLSGTAHCPLDIPPAVFDAVPELLLKSGADRERDHVIAKAVRSDIGLRDKLRRIVRRRERFAAWWPYFGWLVEQTHAALAGLLTSSARQRKRGIAALEDWLKPQ